MTQQSTKKSARERLLDAAGRLFSEQTIHGTKMHDIAQEAVCSRATLHANFPSKDELLEEVIRRELVDIDETVPKKPSGDDRDSLRADLIQLANAYYKFYSERKVLILVFPDIVRNPRLRDIMINLQQTTIMRLTLLYAHYKDKGIWSASIDSVDVEKINDHISVTFLGGIFTRMMWGMAGLAEPIVRDFDQYVDDFLNGYSRHSN